MTYLIFFPSQAVAECVVVINDINDNSPVFLYPVYTGSVAEGSPVGSTVIVVSYQLDLQPM